MGKTVEVRKSVFNSVNGALKSLSALDGKRRYTLEDVCARLPNISRNEIHDCLRSHPELKEAAIGSGKYTFGKRQPKYSKELGASNEPVYEPPRQILIDD